MLYSQRQPPKCRQFDVTELRIAINGALATPVADGMDAKFIKTVQDLGAGNYKITFKDKAQRNLLVDTLQCATPGLYGIVTATDLDSITVLFKTFAGVATDAAFTAQICFHQNKTLY